MCFESHLGANFGLIGHSKYSCSIPFPLSGREIRTVQEHGLVVLSELNRRINAANAQQRRHMSLRNASSANLKQNVWLQEIIRFFSTLLDNFFNSVFWSVIHQLRKSFHIYPKNFSLLDWTPLEERAFLYFLFFSNSGCNFFNSGKKVHKFQIFILFYKNPENFSSLAVTVWSQRANLYWKIKRLAELKKSLVELKKCHQHVFLIVFGQFLEKIRRELLILKIS